MEISKGYLALPLNVPNIKTVTYNNVFIIKNPTTYPFFDSQSTGVAKSNLARLHYERIRATHEIKRIYISETQYDFNDTCEMLDTMYVDVFKEQMGFLTYWYQIELTKFSILVLTCS